MCEICRQNPCNPRCPNAPDPVGKLTCSNCEGPIFEGEQYIELENGPVCEGCLNDMTVSEFMDAYCIELQRA